MGKIKQALHVSAYRAQNRKGKTMLAQTMGNNVLKVNLKDSRLDGDFAAGLVRSYRDRLHGVMEQLESLSQDVQLKFDDAIHATDYRDVKNILIQMTDLAWAAHHELTKSDHNVINYLEALNEQDPRAYQEYLREYRGYCDIHQEVYQEIFAGEHMCESCYESYNAPGVCASCHEHGDIVERGYCRECLELYKDDVNS